jgi:pimeloyl-ACP methyl ester carboxylesterase
MRQSVRIESRQVSYIEAGVSDGPVVVLLHAFPLAAEMWTPQLDAAPRGWRMIAPDMAGLGQSDDVPGPPVLDDYAREVILLLDRLQITAAVVGGISLGGYVSLALARLSPERLTGLILADTRAGADSDEARHGRNRMLAALHDEGIEAVARSMLPRLVGRTTLHERPELVERVRSMILGSRGEGLARALVRLRDRPDATPTLTTIRVPTLIVVGEEDEVTPPGEAEQLRAGISHARLDTIPRAGHVSNLENAEAFTGALDRFLTIF